MINKNFISFSAKNICLFAVWTGAEFKTVRINKADQFWKEKMEPKLKFFYQKCLFPGMVDGRNSRSMPISNIRTYETLNKCVHNFNKIKHVKLIRFYFFLAHYKVKV